MSQIGSTSATETAFPAPARDERRREPRRRVFLRGRIVYGASGISTDCAIKDISASGARIQVHPDAMTSDMLLIVVKDGVAHESRTAWRGGPQAGLDFVNSIPLQGDAPPHMRAVQRMWLELAPR